MCATGGRRGADLPAQLHCVWGKARRASSAKHTLMQAPQDPWKLSAVPSVNRILNAPGSWSHRRREQEIFPQSKSYFQGIGFHVLIWRQIHLSSVRVYYVCRYLSKPCHICPTSVPLPLPPCRLEEKLKEVSAPVYFLDSPCLFKEKSLDLSLSYFIFQTLEEMSFLSQ